jgi:hypothetical protein
MIANNIKKEIINNWSNDFVNLSVYAQNKLYKICGAFVLGIEILNLPKTEDYRPFCMLSFVEIRSKAMS